MNRRSFLSAVARLGAAVVASPLAALLPKKERLVQIKRLEEVPDGTLIMFGSDHSLWAYCAGNLDKLGGLSK